MTATELLAQLKHLEIRIWLEGNQLRISAPKGVMSPELRGELVNQKAELIALLEEDRPEEHGTQPIPCMVRTGDLPYVFRLSSAQERMWFLEQLESSTANQIVWAVELDGELDTRALRQALDGLVQRHEVLRTTFRTMDGQPVQVIAGAGTAAFDVRAAATEDDVQAALVSEAHQPFDLERGPLLRTVLLRRDDRKHVLVVAIHHIACDGWSLGLFQWELSALYAAARLHVEPQFPALPIQYADYAQWQRDWLGSKAFAEQLSYWRTQLQGPLPILELPTDHLRPPVESHRGAWLPLSLSSETTRELMAFGQRENATLFMVLITAFTALIARYTGQEDVIIGTPVAGRSRPELEGLIGLFLNTLVLRMDVKDDLTFVDLLRHVRETALNAYANQDVPFERLIEELQPTRDPSRNPLFQVMFVMQNPGPAQEFAGLEVRPLRVDRGASLFDLTLYMGNVDGRLQGQWEYNTDLFERATIARLAEHFGQVLAALAADPTQRLSQVALLTAGEQAQIATWNATVTPYPREAGLLGLVRDHVVRCPDAMAVRQGERRLTYGALDAGVEQMAGFLRGFGVRPGALVGVCLDRTPEMVVCAARPRVSGRASGLHGRGFGRPGRRHGDRARRADPGWRFARGVSG
jgi:hypothetical protein